MATKASVKKTSTKSTSKKPPQSATGVKRSTVKETTVKKTGATKSIAKSSVPKKAVASKAAKMQSLKLAPETENFMSVKITMQTVYWVIICLLSLAFALWILTVQADINNLYDQIETLQQEEMSLSDRYNI